MNKLKLLLVGSLMVYGVHCSSSAPAPAPAKGASGAAAAKLSNVPVLTALRVDGSHLLLETSGSPAYTAYSLEPDVFVVDLPRATKSKELTIPSQLPDGVASIAADESVELGMPLTRVTVRMNRTASPHTTVSEAGVLVDLGFSEVASQPSIASVPVTPPADSSAVSTSVPAAEVLAAAAAPAMPESSTQSPAATPVPEPAAAIVVTADTSTPVAQETKKSDAPVETTVKVSDLDATVSLPAANGKKATRLRDIVTQGSGSSLEISLIGDGTLEYKAFRLSSPLRVVIDVMGVQNDVKKKSVPLGDPYVKDIRVSQFSLKPNAVTRVVLDLDEAVDYRVSKGGAGLVVSFGVGAAPVPQIAVGGSNPAPVMMSASAADTRPVVTADSTTSPAASQPPSGDVAAQVPPVADAYLSPTGGSHGKGKMTRHVINAPAQQPAPQKTTTTTTTTQATQPAHAEDVFIEPADQKATQTTTSGTTTNLASGAGTLTVGNRTLSPGEKLYTGEPIDLSLKDADIKDVLRLFAQLTGLNIAIDPGVTGTVTVDFQGVPWDQALELILKQNGLGFDVQGNVMRIGTIDRLSAEQAQARKLDEDKRLNVPLTTVSHKLSYARAQDVSTLLKDMASPRGKIIVDARTNQLIITEIPQFLQVMLNMIDTVDIQTPQVSIEARIIETTKNFSQQFGFSWNFNGAFNPALGTGTGLQFPNSGTIVGGPLDFTGGAAPLLGLTLNNVLGTFDLDLALNAAENEGLVRIVSAPRVTMQDNQQAIIESGVQIPLQTRVNFTTTVTYINATLNLTVTPQITAEDTVIMDIQVAKVDPALGLALAAGTNSPLVTRKATTKLMVRDGGTAVIGGIYQATENNNQDRIPFIYQIPILGALFKSHNISSSHDELLIFITPRIIRKS